MLYPFLFRIGTDADSRWLVKVAVFDYVSYDSRWMADPTMPEGQVLVPDVDIAKECRVFDSEKAALAFIKSWWLRQVTP